MLACILHIAATQGEVDENLSAFAETADNLGHHTIGGAWLNDVGFEDIVLQCPNLGRSLYVLNLLVLGKQGLVGSEAQGLGGNGENIVLLEGVDGDIGCKTRLQLQVVVGGRDDYLVGNDIAGSGGLLANLSNLTLEMIVGESIDGEADALTFLYTTDVGLVDISNHAHIGQVLGNGEELWGVERGSNGLAFLNGFGEYHAIDRRGDGGIAQIGLGLANTLARRGNGLTGFLIAQTGALEFVGTNQSLVVQGLIAVEIGLLVIQRALC